MTRRLVCDACARRFGEIKPVGVLSLGPKPCALCGVTLPPYPNGITSGNPVSQVDLARLQAK